MRSLWKTLAAATLFFNVGVASAMVIGFDDLPTRQPGLGYNAGPIPDGYMGLTWEGGAPPSDGPVFSGSGPFNNFSGPTTTSGSNYLTVPEGTVGFAMPDGRTFDFNGFSARSAGPNSPEEVSAAIYVIAWTSDSQYLQAGVLPNETYQRYNFNWVNVTSVYFGLGGSMLIDDIEINHVPEPTSLALLAAGLLAAASARRKRREP